MIFILFTGLKKSGDYQDLQQSQSIHTVLHQSNPASHKPSHNTDDTTTLHVHGANQNKGDQGAPQDLLLYQEILKTNALPPRASNYNKKKKKETSLFQFTDMKLKQANGASKPINYALNTALNFLNYEFSEKKFPAVSVPKPGVTFRKETANKMDIVKGSLPVGTMLAPNQTRHILIGV